MKNEKLAKSLQKFNREVRLTTMREVGTGFTVGKTIRSEKEKQNDPKKQRKNKSWMKEIE